MREGAARADITAEFEPSAQLAALLAPWLEEAGFDNLEPGAPLLPPPGSPPPAVPYNVPTTPPQLPPAAGLAP